MWVFQLDGHGVLIPPEDQTYVWMAPYLEGLANSSSQKSLLSVYVKVAPVPLSLPLERFDWATFIESARSFMGPNFMQFVMLLAGGISAFHYQRVLSIVGKQACCCCLNLYVCSPASSPVVIAH